MCLHSLFGAQAAICCTGLALGSKTGIFSLCDLRSGEPLSQIVFMMLY